MQLVINDKKVFLRGFLQPISKINDSCVISVTDKGLHCTTCTPDASIILSTKLQQEIDTDKPFNLNISDIRKVIKAIECIEKDTFILTLDRNNISYNSKEIKFKYHLLEDNIISIPKLNVDKLHEINFPINFNIQYKALIELLRGSTFTTDSNKIYIYSKDTSVYADLTDRSRHNVDSFTLPIHEGYVGDSFDNLCLTFELVRIISGVRVKQLDCKINPKLGVVMFELCDGQITTRYITSSYVK